MAIIPEYSRTRVRTRDVYQGRIPVIAARDSFFAAFLSGPRVA